MPRPANDNRPTLAVWFTCGCGTRCAQIGVGLVVRDLCCICCAWESRHAAAPR